MTTAGKTVENRRSLDRTVCYTRRHFMAKIVLGRGLGALIQTRVAPAEAAGRAGRAGAGARSSGRSRSTKSSAARSSRARISRRNRCRSWSIPSASRGIIQPLIVRKVDGHYELIAGERRWRAATTLGPRPARRSSCARRATGGAGTRADREPPARRPERGRGSAGLRAVGHEFYLRQEDIAQKVGKSRAAVANAMRLLDLDPQVQSWLTQDRLSVGHAKVLLGDQDQPTNSGCSPR